MFKKMSRWFGLLIIVFVLAGVQVDEAQAVVSVLNIDWSFTNSGATFGTRETVFIRARVFNHNTSSRNLTSSNFAVFANQFYPDPAGTYGEFLWGPAPGVEPPFDQLAGLNLAPGENFDFVFARYVPSGNTPTGLYSTTHFLGFNGVDSYNRGIFPFEWSVVPEPSSMLLLGIGLLGAGVFKRRKKT